jgi:hypothetical protein
MMTCLWSERTRLSGKNPVNVDPADHFTFFLFDNDPVLYFILTPPLKLVLVVM